ncbi:hypothetical protein BDV96DRAFT_647053 [Lophiotrema nucula]|uniref:F-box domain-containing protein n=1 Tax=Lophiotrema nucula TaxID=690887 RepID=A0A6A5Z4R0_9PLEO|nr:hypothetical protein BDV96DRAFT_647053 [Lophiotrema nucula]
MALLTDLPNELLLEILGYSTAGGHRSDLVNIALTCRKLRPAAEEVLYQNIKVLPGRISRLLHTMLQRPDLAGITKKLEITFSRVELGKKHVEKYEPLRDPFYLRLKENCPCRLIRKFTLMEPLLDHREECSYRNLTVGIEPATAGFLISLIPDLEKLTCKYDERSSPGTGMLARRKNLSLYDVLTREELLQITDLSSHPSRSPNLAKPKALETNHPISVPSRWLQNLTTLHVEIPESQSGIDTLDLGPTQSLPLVHTLTVVLDLDAVNCRYPGVIEYFRALLTGLPNLRCLSIHLAMTLEEMERDHFEQNLGQVMFSGLNPMLEQCQSVETLIVDTASVPSRYFMESDERPYPYSVYYTTYDYAGSTSLTNLTSLSPKLRRLVVPEPALFIGRTCHSFLPLPDTIESIEVIDSTFALKTWAEDLLKSKQRGDLPKLSQIILWYDHFEAVLEGADDSSDEIDYQSDGEEFSDWIHSLFGDEDGLSDGNDSDSDDEDDLEIDKFDDQVWNDLKLEGVEVVPRPNQNLGWRLTDG